MHEIFIFLIKVVMAKTSDLSVIMWLRLTSYGIFRRVCGNVTRETVFVPKQHFLFTRPSYTKGMDSVIELPIGTRVGLFFTVFSAI